MAAKQSPHRGTDILALVKDAPRPKLQDRGRLLYADDVMALLSTQGRTVSRWWVNHSFAPELAFKVGRANAWWEVDALRWLDSQQRAQGTQQRRRA